MCNAAICSGVVPQHPSDQENAKIDPVASTLDESVRRVIGVELPVRRREFAEFRVYAHRPLPALTHHVDGGSHGVDFAVHDIHDVRAHRDERIERPGEIHIGQVETDEAFAPGAPTAAQPQPHRQAGLERRLHGPGGMAGVLHHLQGDQVHAAVRQDGCLFAQRGEFDIRRRIVADVEVRRQIRERPRYRDVLAGRLPRSDCKAHGVAIDACKLIAQPGRFEVIARGAEGIGDDHFGTGADVGFVHLLHDLRVGVYGQPGPGGLAHGYATPLQFRTGSAVENQYLFAFQFFVPGHDDYSAMWPVRRPGLDFCRRTPMFRHLLSASADCRVRSE